MKANIFLFLFFSCILIGLFLLLNTEFNLVEVKFPEILIEQNVPASLSWAIILILISVIAIFFAIKLKK
jgi:hypothetical protein